jgi:hypothetical protein
MAASIKNPEYDFEKEVRLISVKQDPDLENLFYISLMMTSSNLSEK